MRREALGIGGAAVVLAIALGGAAWAGARAWMGGLPPALPAAEATQATLSELAEGGASSAAIPAAGLGFPRWRMALRRPLVPRRAHVRTWLVAARITGMLTGEPAHAPPQTADVWVIGVEVFCREMGPLVTGGTLAGHTPSPPPPIPTDALCWQDQVYHGRTGGPWWVVAGPMPAITPGPR